MVMFGVLKVLEFGVGVRRGFGGLVGFCGCVLLWWFSVGYCVLLFSVVCFLIVDVGLCLVLVDLFGFGVLMMIVFWCLVFGCCVLMFGVLLTLCVLCDSWNLFWFWIRLAVCLFGLDCWFCFAGFGLFRCGLGLICVAHFGFVFCLLLLVWWFSVVVVCDLTWLLLAV